MFQVRIHGRGGQGVVTAAEMLSIAAFREGKHAQAFPSFGSERMGAPVMAFCRIDDVEIRLREPVLAPDALIVQDPTLIHQVDLFRGLEATGCLLVNTSRTFDELGIGPWLRGHAHVHARTLAATEIALRHVGRPLPNVPLLGGFAALTGLVSIESVVAAIHEKFRGTVASGNEAAAREAFARVEREEAEVAEHARAD